MGMGVIRNYAALSARHAHVARLGDGEGYRIRTRINETTETHRLVEMSMQDVLQPLSPCACPHACPASALAHDRHNLP